MEEFYLKDGRKVYVRPLEAGDFEGFCCFFEQLAEETIYTNQYPGRPRKSQEAYNAQLYSENFCRWVVIDENGAIVGTCSIGIERADHPWLKYGAGFGIMFLKEYTGQGLGRFLMQKMEQWVRDKGAHRISAEVRAKNVAALALYLKCGFVVEGLARHAAFINNEWHDHYYISKILD